MVALLALLACGPAQSGSGSRAQDDSSGRSTLALSTRPVHLAVDAEPSVIGSKFGGGGSGAVDFPFIFHAQLTQFDPSGNVVPVLVEAAPSLADGSWRLFDDGQMETTYRLRPGLTWHDGATFSAEDVIFTWRAILNPALPAIDRMPEKYIESVETSDGLTLVVRWTRPYIFANAWDLQPIPRHVLEPLVGDPHAFSSAAHWTTEWVGLGPYRLKDWIHGSQVKGEAFSRFALGAPKIQTVVLHIVADANQAVAQMLGGVIDVTVAGTIRPDEGVIIRDQLGARGEASLVTIPNKMRHGVLQFRDPNAPWVRDLRVRQALMHAMDRQEMADSLLQGYSRVADMYIAPADPTFPIADRVVRKYPYDPNRAIAILAEAGWVRAGDGIARNAAGEQIDLEVRTSPDVQSGKEAQLLADMWKRVGFNTTMFTIPRTEQRNQEYRARFPGVTTTSIASLEAFYYTSDTIPHEANGWQGTNRGGYSSPEGDRLDHLYFTTIDANQRQHVLIDILKLVSEELPYLAFYYNVDTHAVRTGLEGITSRWDRQPGMSFNIYAWRWTQ